MGRDGDGDVSNTGGQGIASVQKLEQEREREHHQVKDGNTATTLDVDHKHEEELAMGNTTSSPTKARIDGETTRGAYGPLGATTTTTTAGEVVDSDAPGEDVQRAGVVYKVYKRRWVGLVQLALLNIAWLTFSPVSQFAAEYYGTTESTINWLSTGFLFAFVVVCPLTIYALHRGPKPSMITSAVLLLLGNWIRYAGTRGRSGGNGNGIFGVVMLGQILIGFAQPFALGAPTRYSDLWFTSRGRTAATALTSLANPLGAALGQLVVPFLCAAPGDVPDLVLYVSVISTLCAVGAFFVPAAPPTPPAPSAETPKEGSLAASVRLVVRSPECWLLLVPFTVYVGLFNSLSSLLNQILSPYNFTPDEAGIAGAVLIAAGLAASAVASPLVDRTRAFLPAIKICVPLVAAPYLVFIWMPGTRALAGPYAVLALLGAASFALLPVALEFLAELAHPCGPEVTSVLAWAPAQLLGGCFILISDALRDDEGAGDEPPGNMRRALVFQAVLAVAVVPLPLALGLFGRRDKVALRRLDDDALARRGGLEPAV